MADIRNTGTWQRVERGLSEMANLYSRGEYNLALVKGRQTMEQIVRLYAGQSFVVYTDLADTIENLYQGRYIGKDTRDSFHIIRLLGNKAVHEGDNEPQDAERSYQLLENEIRRFAGGSTAAGNQKAEEAPADDRASAQGQPDLLLKRERTRVPAEGTRRSTESRRRYDRLDDRSSRDTNKVPTREDRLRAQRNGKNSRSGRGQKQPQGNGVTVYDVLRVLIPAICIILLVVLIRSLLFGGKSEPETTAPTVTETVAETEPVTVAPPETEPETTAPAVLSYRIKGNAVNVRYADNENRVYTQLANGTEIGEATPVEGTDKMQFTLDGIAVTVNKNYIEAIEPAAPSAAETANPLAETAAQ
ncbi:MAG: DUF4145 domain-containing protein [Eubacteriales bacterium]|nr:DUF4145 domain-containing protein [Eubacteriales bacterium]